MTTVGIIGVGNVGAALARNMTKHGVSVRLASRDVNDARNAAKELGPNATGVPMAEVGSGAEIVLLTVPANAAEAAIASAGDLSKKIVVDCTNPLRWDEGPVHAPPSEGSVAAHLQARFPATSVVKAFNTFGAEFHENPAMTSVVAADLYLAGDDQGAKAKVAALAETMGFVPVDVGPMRNAAHLESLAVLWIHLAMVEGRGREVAFKLLRR